MFPSGSLEIDCKAPEMKISIFSFSLAKKSARIVNKHHGASSTCATRGESVIKFIRDFLRLHVCWVFSKLKWKGRRNVAWVARRKRKNWLLLQSINGQNNLLAEVKNISSSCWSSRWRMWWLKLETCWAWNCEIHVLTVTFSQNGWLNKCLHKALKSKSRFGAWNLFKIKLQSHLEDWNFLNFNPSHGKLIPHRN